MVINVIKNVFFIIYNYLVLYNFVGKRFLRTRVRRTDPFVCVPKEQDGGAKGTMNIMIKDVTVLHYYIIAFDLRRFS